LGKIFLGGIKHAILTNPKHFIATVCGIAEAFDLDWIRRKRRETKGMMEQLLKTKQGSMSKQHRME
jgi:hypothetical protein